MIGWQEGHLAPKEPCFANPQRFSSRTAGDGGPGGEPDDEYSLGKTAVKWKYPVVVLLWGPSRVWNNSRKEGESDCLCKTYCSLVNKFCMLVWGEVVYEKVEVVYNGCWAWVWVCVCACMSLCDIVIVMTCTEPWFVVVGCGQGENAADSVQTGWDWHKLLSPCYSVVYTHTCKDTNRCNGLFPVK